MSHSLNEKRLLTQHRCKEENNQWTSLIGRANRKQVDVVDRITRKRAANAEPDTSRAEQWMKDALGLAQGILAEGEGDLSAMGEFADVEYKVSLQHSPRLRMEAKGSGRYTAPIESSCAPILSPSTTFPRRHLLLLNVRPKITRTSGSPIHITHNRLRSTRRINSPIYHSPEERYSWSIKINRSNEHASRTSNGRSKTTI